MSDTGFRIAATADNLRAEVGGAAFEAASATFEVHEVEEVLARLAGRTAAGP